MLRLSDLSFRAGSRLLLDRANAAIGAGHRAGLVGRNGAGKTTLLRLVAGELEPDGGRIERPPRWRVGMTRQEAPGGGESLIDTVLGSDIELVRLTREAETAKDPGRIAEIHTRLADIGSHEAPARAARILAGLGFSEAAQRRPLDEYSGGWRMRVALAGLLFARPDLLLLDEPTNHLDLEASLWLERHLAHYPGTILLVSHDRDLLNRVVGEILHLDRGTLTLYAGDYDRFESALSLRLAQDERARRRQEAERARIQAFVDRFRYKATKARQAQSRLKMLARMQPIPEQGDGDRVGFALPDPEPLAPPLITLEGVSAGYDGRPVLTDVSLRLDADDRVALLGANGNGKSTLVKLLAGRIAPLGGDVRRSARLRIGYFAQHQTDELDLEATPIDALRSRRPRDPEAELRSRLGGFGFSQERALTKIACLSGGEKARLLLALVASERPHVLLLDEPTNHLDIEAREALIQALNAFAGAVVVVTHDAHVIELTADRLWLVDGGRVVAFSGDMEEYRALLLGRDDGERAADGVDGDRGGSASPRKDQRRRAAVRRQTLAPLKTRLAEAEAALERLESEKARLAQALSDPALYAGDRGALVDLQKRLGRIERDLAAAEATWIDLHEAWDRASVEET